MQDRPTREELLATVAEYLEAELIPALDGSLAYRSRVAANLVRILQREQAQSGTSLRREYALLCGLLDIESQGTMPDVRASDALADAVLELNRRVVAAIDADTIAHERAWPALMEIARAKLAIIRPGYDAWDATGELP